MQCRALGCFQQQLAALSAGAQRHGGGHRPGSLQVVVCRQRGAGCAEKCVHMGALRRIDAQQRLVAVRRQLDCPPFRQQFARR